MSPAASRSPHRRPDAPSTVRPAPGSAATPGQLHTAPAWSQPWCWPSPCTSLQSRTPQTGWASQDQGRLQTWCRRARLGAAGTPLGHWGQGEAPHLPIALTPTRVVPGPSPQPEQACRSRPQLASQGHERPGYRHFGFSQPSQSAVQALGEPSGWIDMLSSKGALKAMSPGP